MLGKNFLEAVSQLAEEKKIDRKVVLETIETALAAAFRKDYGDPDQNVKVELDAESGDFKVYDEKTVVKELDEEMAKREREFILLADAKKEKKTAKEGDVIRKEITPKEAKFGRIAAQTAKQVVIQRIREAERAAVYDEYKDKEGEVLNATVQRVEGNTLFIDLGTTIGIMYPQDQIRGENYSVGQRFKVYIREVKVGPKGPEILVSRTDAGLVKKLFELEVPEIYAKTVEIKGLVREAGSRSKMAVHTADDSIDPIGSCVGQKGTRVQTVKAELGGENIDIIVWDEDPAKYITNALSPAKIKQVKLDTEKKEALVAVEEDQLSLAIGKSGQNVRLAAKLTGWKIDIVKEEESEKDKKAESKEAGADTKKKKLETKNKDAAKKEADTDSKNTEKSADKATKKKKK
jgi:transcription termination/antitermination protein NusA